VAAANTFRQNCRAIHTATVSLLLRVRPMILSYLEDPTTQQWINQLDGRNEEWVRVKQQEVSRCWTQSETILQFMDNHNNSISTEITNATNADFYATLHQKHQRAAERRWLSGQW